VVVGVAEVAEGDETGSAWLLSLGVSSADDREEAEKEETEVVDVTTEELCGVGIAEGDSPMLGSSSEADGDAEGDTEIKVNSPLAKGLFMERPPRFDAVGLVY